MRLSEEDLVGPILRFGVEGGLELTLLQVVRIG